MGSTTRAECPFHHMFTTAFILLVLSKQERPFGIVSGLRSEQHSVNSVGSNELIEFIELS
jgi:hypothetical protein